jgi:parallel beta-helix repeat protein
MLGSMGYGAAGERTLKSQGPDGMTAVLLWVALALLLVVGGLAAAPSVPPPASATLYVSPGGSNTGPGTVDHPFRTMSEAARVASPGTNVRVAPGTYTDPVVTRASGNSTARVRFVSSTRWGARIRVNGGDRAWLNDADYVDIEGFDISAPDARSGLDNEGSHVRIEHNHVHHVANRLTAAGCDHDGGAGIVNGNSAAGYNEISANLVHDIGDYTNPRVPGSCWTVQGIYDAAPRGTVLNNIAYRNEAFGIHLWHAASGNVVANNLSFNNGVGGIQVGAGDSPGGITADDYVVANNLVLDNPLFGIRAAGVLGLNNRYLNNLLYRNGSTYTGIGHGISGTLEVDPQFVNYQVDGFDAGGDFHLRSTSPVIGAGHRTGAPSIDYDGASRPATTVNLGPFALPRV